MQKSRLCPQIFAAVSASLILIGTGFHLGWASPSLAKLQDKDSDVLVTPSQGSWIASFLLIGTLCGSILGFILIDRVGRKTTLLLMSIPQCTACLLISVAKTYWLFYIARFIAGFGSGAILTGIPMYMGEIAEDRIRGGMGILMNLMINLGTLMAFAIGPWVSRTTLGLSGAVIPIVYLVAFIWAPESPYYYAMKRLPHKVEKSLQWLRGISNVGEEVKSIQSNVDFKRKHAGTITELFTVTGNQKAIIISMGLVTCQQVSGISAILSYSTIIFKEVDSGLSSSWSVILMGIVKCSTAVGIIFIVDKAGRRPLLLTSTTLCVIFLLCEASYFHLQAVGIDVKAVSWLPLVAMVGYLVSFTAGIGTLPMVVASEIFPVEVKALAMTANAVYLAAAGICVTKFYQIITDTYGIHISYYIFAALSTASIVFIYLVVPETKKRSLSQIQDELQGVSKPML